MSYQSPPKPRPHGAMYLVPLFVWMLFSVGACVGGGVEVFTGVSDEVDDLERVSASEGGTVQLEKRDYIVYYEESNGDSDVSDPGITYQILDPDGSEVPVRSRSSSIEYTTGSRSGIAIGRFEADQAGPYTVVVSNPPGIATGGRLTIGGNVLSGAKDGLIIFLVVGTVGFLVALVIAIVIARKRGNSKREIQRGYGGGGYPPGGGGYPQPGGGYGPPANQPPPTGYGAPGSYPPPGGYGAPGSYPPPGGQQQPGGYQQPPGGFPPG